MKFGMSLSEFRPALGHLELSSPRVGCFFLINGHIETADQYGNWYTGR